MAGKLVSLTASNLISVTMILNILESLPLVDIDDLSISRSSFGRLPDFQKEQIAHFIAGKQVCPCEAHVTGDIAPDEILNIEAWQTPVTSFLHAAE